MPKKLLSFFLLIISCSNLSAQSLPDSLFQLYDTKTALQQDPLRVLNGVFPGLQITSTGGISGSGTNAVIRGYSSLNAVSDPLIIVDGIRFDTQNNQNNSSFSGGGSLVTPNRIIDINPSEIIDIQVLNSLEATIRYGEAARNGVILISTSRDKFNQTNEKLEFSYQQSIYSTRISNSPDYQNQYGLGFDGEYIPSLSSWGPAFSQTDASAFGTYYSGINNDGQILVTHPLLNNNANTAIFPEFTNQDYVYSPKSTAIDEFFDASFSSSSILNAKLTKPDYSLKLDYAGSWENGFTPNNSFNRNNVGISFLYPISEKVKSISSLQFALTNIQSPVISAGLGQGRGLFSGIPSVFSDIFYTPRSIGFDLPYQNPETGGSVYYRAANDIFNPRWTADRTKVINDLSRVFGKTEVHFDINEKLNVLYRYSFDTYDEHQEYQLNPTAVVNYQYQSGLFQTIDLSRTQHEQSLNLLFKDDLNSFFRLSTEFGINYISEQIEEEGLESSNMIRPEIFEHRNFRDQSPVNSFSGTLFGREYDRRTMSFFNYSTLTYLDQFYLTGGLRSDLNFSLKQQELSAWYPAIKLGYKATNSLDYMPEPISHLRIEVGYFTSGRGLFTEDEISLQERASVAENDEIKPERSTEKQLSLELGFFENRLSLKSVLYNRIHSDLISRIVDNSDPVFSSILDNLMEIETDGIELSLSVIPIQRKLNWSILALFSSYKTNVNEYTGNFTAVQLGDSQTLRGNWARVNEPFMSMYGTQIFRVDEDLKENDPTFANIPIGTPIIDNNGNYINGNIGVIGNPIPDWNASMVHQISFRNFEFSVQLEYQKGGDMFSSWISSLLGHGVVTETTKFDRNETIVLDGVRFDCSQNEIEINQQQYYFNNVGFGPDEMRVYDMTHFRISHIGFQYNLPQKWLQKSRINQVNISISVENAFLFTPNLPNGLSFDPNVNSYGVGVNNLGFEHLTGPGARRVGAAVRLKF